MTRVARRQKLLLLLLVFQGFSRANAFNPAETPLRKAASDLTFFATHDFIYRRFPHIVTSRPSENQVGQSYAKRISSLTEAHFSVDDLTQLLSDVSPRVRTLAMALLFDKEEPHLLPRIFALSEDPGETFRNVIFRHAQMLPDIETAPQTVGDVARAMADFYLRSSDYYSTEFLSISWPKYWAARAGRSYCLSWLRVRMRRAVGGMEPVQGEQRERLIEFRRTLDGIPPVDRDLYRLWLVYETDNRDLATETELIAAARRLGPRRVLQVVSGHPPSSDPDLDFSRLPNWPNLRPISFLLMHADKTMNRAAAPLLASVEKRERLRMREIGYLVGPEYAIARARLQPDKASEILKTAMALYPARETEARALLSAALRELTDHRK